MCLDSASDSVRATNDYAVRRGESARNEPVLSTIPPGEPVAVDRRASGIHADSDRKGGDVSYLYGRTRRQVHSEFEKTPKNRPTSEESEP
jgi:hypothetical protein